MSRPYKILAPLDANDKCTLELLKRHYVEQNLFNVRGDDVGWESSRVKDLCVMLHVRPIVLGAIFGIPRKTMKKYMNAKRFPTAYALHFEMLRQWHMEQHGIVSKPVFPGFAFERMYRG